MNKNDAAAEMAEKIVRDNGGNGQCSCDHAFKGRGLRDPHCQWCDWGKGTRDDIASTLRPLLEALEFYADANNWLPGGVGIFAEISRDKKMGERAAGMRARQALEGCEK